jgi:hypothetical protein
MLLYQDELGVAFDVTSVKDVASLRFYESVGGAVRLSSGRPGESNL